MNLMQRRKRTETGRMNMHCEAGRMSGRGMKLAAIAACSAVLAVLTGCGAGLATQQGPIAGAAFQGRLYGGQQPVVGATIQLYAVGTTGYGSDATPLLPTVKSVAGGNFTITGLYTCPSASSLVYLTATGGNTGAATDNANLSLMAALGPCGNLQDSTFILMNEVTTVASVYALSPFMVGPTKVGAPASNATGIANAFGDVNLLVNTATGTSPGTVPAGTVVPSAAINTLANILAACINSGGGVAGDSNNCGKLFSAAKPGATAPTDTVTAAVNIAQNPALNVTALYGLGGGVVPFQPTLAVQPANFLLAVQFQTGLKSPAALAVDGGGDVWVANAGDNTVAKLGPNGAVLSGSGFTASLNTPSAIAVDTTGSVWITNSGNNTISRLTNAGSAFAGAPYSGGGLNQPSGISFDDLGNAWIANAGNGSVSEFSPTGVALSPAGGYTGTGVVAPIGVAVTAH